MVGPDEINSGGDAAESEELDTLHGGEGFADTRTGQLQLGDDDVRLPWLEGDDDEEEYEGYNAAQVIGLVLLGLLVLGAVVGGIWWATRHSSNPNLVADGSVIQAPAEPYKMKPANPGGKTFQGTGDTSFAVSEGQTRPAHLGAAAPAPAKAAAAKKAAPAAKTPAPSVAVQTPADSSQVGVQVAAYSNRDTAETGWTRLQQQYPALSGLHHRIVEGRADIGTVYRLQVLADDVASAKTLCGNLKAAGLNCQVKR
jgi:hypothetical protein